MLFTGRLTGNAAAKTVKDNKSLIEFTVALNQKWKNKAGEKKEKSVFVDCTYWRNTGLAEYLGKGAVVEISGWVEAEAYQSTTRGLQSRLVCTCDTIKLFSPMTSDSQTPMVGEAVQAGAGGEAGHLTGAPYPTGTGADDDDLPF
jgi:single-strand DNA-binding protein